MEITAGDERCECKPDAARQASGGISNVTRKSIVYCELHERLAAFCGITSVYPHPRCRDGATVFWTPPVLVESDCWREFGPSQPFIRYFVVPASSYSHSPKTVSRSRGHGPAEVPPADLLRAGIHVTISPTASNAPQARRVCIGDATTATREIPRGNSESTAATASSRVDFPGRVRIHLARPPASEMICA